MRLWHVAVIACLGAVGAGFIAVERLLPSPTIEAAVVVVLDQAGAPTGGVYVRNGRCVPTNELCLNYIADIVVPGELGVGRLVCASPWEDCTLSMMEFGVRNARVPRVAQPSLWIARVEAQVERFMALVRAGWRRMAYVPLPHVCAPEPWWLLHRQRGKERLASPTRVSSLTKYGFAIVKYFECRDEPSLVRRL